MLTSRTMHRDEVPIRRRCDQTWNDLRGSGATRRRCLECNTEVVNLSAMAERDAKAFLRDVRGEICLAYRFDPSGRIAFREPIVPAGRLHRIGAAAAAAVTLTACADAGPKSAPKAFAVMAKYGVEPRDKDAADVVIVHPNTGPLPRQDAAIDCALMEQLHALGGYGASMPEECRDEDHPP